VQGSYDYKTNGELQQQHFLPAGRAEGVRKVGQGTDAVKPDFAGFAWAEYRESQVFTN